MMSAMSELDMDRQRVELVSGPSWQQVCVASLVGNCEAIAASGHLPEPAERSLRLLIAETLSAFGMQHNQQYDHELSLVKGEMEQRA